VSTTGPRDAAAFEVREALGQPGCAICRVTQRSVIRLLRTIASEQVNDLELRSQLRSAGGFCNPHAYAWLREAKSTLGTALMYRDVLTAAQRELDSPPRGRRGRTWIRPDRPVNDCPACLAQREAEARYIEALLASLAAEETSRVAFDASDGLCRRHALAAIRSGRDGAECAAQRTRQVVAALIADLDEVIRKEDYRFRHEPRKDAERSAPARAVGFAAGFEGLVDN